MKRLEEKAFLKWLISPRFYFRRWKQVNDVSNGDVFDEMNQEHITSVWLAALLLCARVLRLGFPTTSKGFAAVAVQPKRFGLRAEKGGTENTKRTQPLRSLNYAALVSQGSRQSAATPWALSCNRFAVNPYALRLALSVGVFGLSSVRE